MDGLKSAILESGRPGRRSGIKCMGRLILEMGEEVLSNRKDEILVESIVCARVMSNTNRVYPQDLRVK